MKPASPLWPFKWGTRESICFLLEYNEIAERYSSDSWFCSHTQNSEEKLEKCVSFGDLFFLLYSTTDRFSFMEARRLGRFIRRVKNCECAMILAATKTDLQHLRKISQEEGVDLAQELNSAFSEISISEGFVETNSLLHNTLREYLNSRTELECGEKEKSSPLSRMKEGFKGIYARRKSCSLWSLQMKMCQTRESNTKILYSSFKRLIILCTAINPTRQDFEFHRDKSLGIWVPICAFQMSFIWMPDSRERTLFARTLVISNTGRDFFMSFENLEVAWRNE